MIQSPLTGGNTTFQRNIPTEPIIAHYGEFDIRPLLQGLAEISIYRCDDTGDDAFYQHVSKEPLYYIPWKREHDIANSYIKTGDTVLEQGCANGDFLVRLKEEKNVLPFGTELNTEARAKAAARGVSFATTSTADVACSFQVLEHIDSVGDFITEGLNSIHSGGHLIFGVPNNDSLLKDDEFAYSNMPPHHMGLWTPAIFKKLPDFFPMDLVTVHTETLQPYHYRWYYQVYFGNRFVRFGFAGKVFNKLVYELIGRWIVTMKAKSITGHTIVAVFKKR